MVRRMTGLFPDLPRLLPGSDGRRRVPLATALLTAAVVVGACSVPSMPAFARSADLSMSSAADALTDLAQVPSTMLVEASELPAAAQAVALTDETVYVQVAGTAGPEILYRNRDGGEWLDYWPLSGPGVPTGAIAGELLEAEGSSMLVRKAYGNDTHSNDLYSGGEIPRVQGFPVGSDLAGGGNHVSWFDPATGGLEIRSVAGSAWTRYGGGSGNTILGDQLVVRHWDSAALYSISSSELIEDDTNVCRVSETAATSDFYDGRFSVHPCEDGTVDVIDFAHVYTPWELDTVTLDPATVRAAKGLVVGQSTVSGELIAAPVAGEAPLTIGTAIDYDLDDAQTGLAYLDETGSIRLADLTGLGSEPTATSLDVTAPIIIFSVASTTSLTSEMWMRAYDSPSPDPALHEAGVASVQTRYRTRAAADVEFSDWRVKEPIATVDGQGTKDTAVGEPGGTICMSARSIDKAGNMGEWADEACNQLDGEAPRVTPLPLPTTTRATGEATTVLFEWQVEDNLAVANSEVRYTLTPRGQETGEWVYAKAFEWTHSVESPDLTNVCFSVRAVDRATNTSEWSESVCTFVTADAT